jgi:transcriptional regulator with XRE-family HTH domain
MTGKQFRKLRYSLGLSRLEMGRALGHSGKDNTVKVTIGRYERMQTVPDPVLDRLRELGWTLIDTRRR